MKKIRAIGFDPFPPGNMEAAFILETSKTLANGTCPGHHNAIIQARGGCWMMEENDKENTNGEAVLLLGRG